MTQFSNVLDELLTRWSGLGGEPDALTVTYDAGQNSKLNHTHVEATGIGFVTSLPPSQHRDLLAIPHSDYTIVDEQRFPGLAAHDTTINALGVTRRAIVTHSRTFHDAQTPLISEEPVKRSKSPNTTNTSPKREPDGDKA